MPKCNYCGEEFSDHTLSLHEARCPKNKNKPKEVPVVVETAEPDEPDAELESEPTEEKE